MNLSPISHAFHNAADAQQIKALLDMGNQSSISCTLTQQKKYKFYSCFVSIFYILYFIKYINFRPLCPTESSCLCSQNISRMTQFSCSAVQACLSEWSPRARAALISCSPVHCKLLAGGADSWSARQPVPVAQVE